VGGEKARKLRQHWQHGRRRRGTRAHRWAEPADKQDRRGFADIVGGLPVPRATGVGAGEGRFHRRAQAGGVDATAAFEMGKDQSRGRDDTSGGIGIVIHIWSPEMEKPGVSLSLHGPGMGWDVMG